MKYHVVILERRLRYVEVEAADAASAERAARYNLAHLASVGEPTVVDCEPVGAVLAGGDREPGMAHGSQRTAQT